MSATSGRAECHGEILDEGETAGVTLAGALVRAAAEAPERGVLIIAGDGMDGTLLTYPELLREAGAVRAGLAARGCAAGETVVLWGLEPRDFFPALWGCLLGGMVPLPIAGRDRERLDGALEVLGGARVLTDSAGDSPDFLDIAACRTGEGEGAAVAAADPGATALSLLSSGSTGRPKVIPLTHGGLAAFAVGNARMLGWGTDEVTLNWFTLDLSASLLLYHLLPVHLGMTNAHADTGPVLARPERWMDLVCRHGVRHTWAPAFGYRQLVSRVGEGHDWDLSGVRSLVSGGERITPRLADDLLTALGPFGLARDAFVPAWGMTETCTGITFGRYAGAADRKSVV